MKTVEAVLTTSHVDAHKEAISREGIEMFVEQVNSSCIPMWVQHDPRIPPVGRYTKAKLTTLPDGEVAAVGEGEMWDPGETVPFLPDRRMPLGKPADDRPFVAFDQTLSDEPTIRNLHDIAELIGGSIIPEVRKALDPLTIITIGGTFVGCAIANGFLKQLGADVYVALKEKVKDVFRHRYAATLPAKLSEVLFVFKAFVQDEKGLCVVEVIITNPSDEDIERFFRFGLHKLDEMLPDLLRDRRDIQRIVLEIEGRDLRVKYGVRSDAVPVMPFFP